MSFCLRMSEEQLAAHQRAAEKARLIQREENETEKQADIRARKAQEPSKWQKAIPTLGKPEKSRKYRNKPTVVGDLKFASKREANRYQELQFAEKAGTITDLRCQVRYQININGERVCVYVADFVFQRGDEIVVEDAKGVRTDVYKLKAKLMRIVNGITIVEV
jgi:hypothetical protein